MEFLIDNNISPKVADSLSQNGFGSVHVKNLGMSAATDEDIFEYASENNLTVISADTDFGFICLLGNSTDHQLFYYDTSHLFPRFRQNIF